MYASLASTHIFCPIAIETAGTWNAMAIELVQEIGTHHCHHRRLQGNHIFVPMPVDSSSTGECGLFSKHHDDRMSSRYCSFLIFTPAALCQWAKNSSSNNNNHNI